MSAEAIGKVLQGMGPGLLSGIGNAMQPSAPAKPDPKADPAHANTPNPSAPGTAKPNAFKHGGIVQKTGVALVHKGEEVVTKEDRHTLHNVSIHRAISHMNRGGLHRALNVPEGETIPSDKMESARNSKNPHLRKMANLADTMASWTHDKSKDK